MNKRKTILLVFGASLLLMLTAIPVSAETITDPTGDVYHHTWVVDTEYWTATSEDKPNIDITEVTYSVSGTTLTVTMDVDGTIQNSNKYVYTILYNSTEGVQTFSYAAGIGAAIGIGSGGMQIGTVTASGSTITGTIEISEGSEFISCMGFAFEHLVDYTTLGENITEIEYYADYAPGTLAPWYESDEPEEPDEPGETEEPSDGEESDGDDGDDGEDGGGTPGFELLAVIAALAIAVIILRRRK